jgi:transcriptional regulator NrdR family protein
MKCPTCGTWTLVKETRGIRRRRECANEHRFTTEEIVIPEETIKERQAENFKAHNRKRMVAV